jgi:histidinol phosphatase-like PHP family hydrolase
MLDHDLGMPFMKLTNVLNGTEGLADKYEIENALISMKEMGDKIAFLTELKKRRSQLIDMQISQEEANMEKLEEAIKKCMSDNKIKSLDFPGVAKVSIRNKKGVWTIIDKDKLKIHLQGLGKFDAVSKKEWDFVKKDLNKVLDELKENNNTSDYVKQEPDGTSVSISYAKNEEVVLNTNEVKSSAIPKYDNLEI